LAGKARLDKMAIQMDDMVVGVLYGEPEELSANYKTIDTTYPVFIGNEFWEHLTGDKNFYKRLAKAFGDVVEEENIDGSELIRVKIAQLANEIIENGGL